MELRNWVSLYKKPRKEQKRAGNKEETKKVISSKFISHIVNLGFDEKDAAKLYETKEDWLGMSSGGRVLCIEQGCKFSTPMSSDCMFQHCRTVHNWRDYPCTHDNCNYVAFSKRSFKSHLSKFHSPYQTHNGNYYSCQVPNCRAAFRSNHELIRHERVHNNDVCRCVFCPYVSAQHLSLTWHQRIHFNTREFVCDVCQKAFTTRGMLNSHVRQKHDVEEATTQCPLCDRVSNRRNIKTHLFDAHSVKGIKWNDKQKQYIVPEQI